MENCVFEYNYNLTKENIKNAEKVYNKAVNKKFPIKFILFGIVAVIFLVDYIRTQNIAFLYMMLLCLGFILMIFLNNNIGIYDILCSEQYSFKLCNQKMILKTIVKEQSEDIQPTVIKLSDDNISIYEQDMQFVLVDRENALFYAFPKSGMNSRDISKIKEVFKQNLGERFVEE